MKIIIKDGFKYREILNDLDFELALSSKKIAVGGYGGHIVSDPIALGWNERLCRKVYHDDPDFAPFNFQLLIKLGPTEEADTNSSDS